MPRRRGPWWTQSKARRAHGPNVSQSEEGPRTHVVWALVVQKRTKPHAHAAEATAIIKRRRPPRTCGRGLRCPKAKEAAWPCGGAAPMRHRSR